MNQLLEITYYYHSGFSCAIGDVLCVFDYWIGEHEELPEEKRLTEDYLQQFREIYVFVSHDHPDHVQPEIFRWYKVASVAYIVSYDMPIGTRGKRMAPGDVLELSEHVKVRAYDSTDLGVSYLVELDGYRIFHAGDLNFWHWQDESTNQEIREAEEEFHRAIKPLEKEPVDVAFFPLDPRQGRSYDAGINYYLMTVKPRLLIPMHFFHWPEVAVEFARRSRSRQTEVIAMTKPGEQMRIEMDAEGFMTIHVLSSKREVVEDPFEVKMGGNWEVSLPEDGFDPFADTDLPVQIDEK